MDDPKTKDDYEAIWKEYKKSRSRSQKLKDFFIINVQKTEPEEKFSEVISKYRLRKFVENNEDDFKIIYDREFFKREVPNNSVSHDYFKLDLINDVKELLRQHTSESSPDHKLIYLTNQFLSYLGVPYDKLAPNYSEPPNLDYKSSKVKSIVFDSRDRIEKVFVLLEPYFPDFQRSLLLTLSGEDIDEPLIFKGEQNKLVEVFARLKNNNFILSNKTQINKWLCKNFRFYYSKGEVNEIRELNPSSVKDILSGKQTVSAKSIIFKADWLPISSNK